MTAGATEAEAPKEPISIASPYLMPSAPTNSPHSKTEQGQLAVTAEE